MSPAADNTQPSRGPGLAGSAVQLLVRQAVRLPLTAVSLGFQAWESSRGLRTTVLRHGEEALQVVAHTPLGRLLPDTRLDDGADEEAARIVSEARSNVRETIEQAKDEVQGVASTPTRPAPERTPAAPPHVVPEAARQVGAPGAVTEEVEEISQRVDVAEPESRDDLPIPDFDNISLGSLRARLRSLSVEQLLVLREWEQAHAHRLPVITLLDNRIAKLGTPDDASGGTSAYPADAPADAKAAERRARRAAEEQGGTLRV